MNRRILSPWLLLLLAACRSTPARPGESERIAELERQNAALREQLTDSRSQVELLLSKGFARPTVRDVPPPIDALVIEVRPDLRLVVLDKGAADGVEPGFIFDLYKAASYKGQVRIQSVLEHTSYGALLNEKNAIAPGDSATTQL